MNRPVRGRTVPSLHCDVPGCPARYADGMVAKVGETRRRARNEGWVQVLVRHNETTGGFGTRRVDDLCPDHFHLESTWPPNKGRRKR